MLLIESRCALSNYIADTVSVSNIATRPLLTDEVSGRVFVCL